MHGDRLVVLPPIPEVVALHDARERVLAREPHHAFGPERAEPLGVELDLRRIGVEQLVDLLAVRFRVGGDLLVLERRSRRLLA